MLKAFRSIFLILSCGSNLLVIPILNTLSPNNPIGYFTELILDTMEDKKSGLLNKFVLGGGSNGNDK